MTKSKSTFQKRSKFRKFLDHFCKPGDYFFAIRLILPSLDRERGSYGLKESVLALSLIDALGMSRDSEDAKKLVNWRKGGAKSAGTLAGNFSLVAADVLQRRQGSVSGGLTIRQLNELLDRLASAESRGEKTDLLGELIRKTNWQEMRWIMMIILKDLKLGISEKSIFHEFHPDAEDLFNVTCDLRLVCEKLSDRKLRHKRQDIEVGKAVRPQLAMRVANCAAAWKKLHGKEVVVECKFDGDRIQVHKNGTQVNFFSRNFFDHQEYEHGMSNVIVDNVLADRCILDGEMLVWDTSTNHFADFGSNQEIAKAAREGLESERQLCYVAFDILYVGDTSVIHQTLKERQELLRKAVKPVKGHLEILLPNGSDESLNAHRKPGEPCWSIVANHLNEVERFFKETIENRDEGIILKDLGSKWEPGDRNGKWLKVKPDYVRAGSDLDVLIIGGYYGSGRRGGEVAQFLVGLAERPSPDTCPRRFMSFCRVGTGLSDEELDELVAKLKPYFKKYEYPKKSPPSFYQVTNHSKERPDVWIESPDKSVILAITSDIRTISSEVFAAPYSLRFPRIDRVRYDKPWRECLDVESFMELVHSSNGTTQRAGPEDGGGASEKPKRTKAIKGEGRKKRALAVPSHFAHTDVSNIKGESQIFSNMVFHFVNVPSSHSLDSLHKLVVENGGTFSMNLNDKVTHCVGAESKGIKYEAAKRRGCDVIHYSWVLDCYSQQQLLPLRPKHFIFLSDSSKKKLQEEIDEFSDSYFWDLNVAELKQIFYNVNKSEDVQAVDYYKKKYSPREKWCRFHGCLVYFHLFVKPLSSDWEVLLKLALRRMKVEVSVGGGKVVDNPSQATHVIVLSVPGYELSFETLLQSFPENQKYVLCRKRLHVVGCQWLEDCFKEEQKLPEVKYSLKPTAFEGPTLQEEDEAENDIGYQIDSTSLFDTEKPPKSTPEKTAKTVTLIREQRRKRGHSAGTSSRKEKAAVNKPPRTKRARIGNRPAKLQDIVSDDENSKGGSNVSDDASSELEMHNHVLKESTVDDKPRKAKAVVSKHPTTKRARIGKKPARVQEITSDEETSEEEKNINVSSGNASPELETHGHVFKESTLDDMPSVLESNKLGSYGGEMKNSGLFVKFNSTDGNEGYRQEELQSRVHEAEGHHSDNIGPVTCSKLDNDREYSTTGKLEIMTDHVQAMLLNMIPSLGVKSYEDTAPILEAKNLSPIPPRELSSIRPEGEPVKKKKVSYKDLANSLLKD